MDATALLLWGLVAHLVADWLLQNDWMARHKSRLFSPAATTHQLIHFLALWCVFPWGVAFSLAFLHALVDTRAPLTWWRRIFRQTSDPTNPASLHVAMWGDQTLHILCIAGAALLVGGRP